MFFRRDPQLAVERVVPHLFHVFPVGDDSVLNRSLNLEYTALLLRLFTDVKVFLVEADHNSGDSRPPYDSWKEGARSVVSCEPCFART